MPAVDARQAVVSNTTPLSALNLMYVEGFCLLCSVLLHTAQVRTDISQSMTSVCLFPTSDETRLWKLPELQMLTQPLPYQAFHTAQA